MKYTVTISGFWSGNCYDVEAGSAQEAMKKCKGFGPEEADELTDWVIEEMEAEEDEDAS